MDKPLSEQLAYAIKTYRESQFVIENKDAILYALQDGEMFNALLEQDRIRMPRVLPPFMEDPHNSIAYSGPAAIRAAIDSAMKKDAT